MTRRSLARFLAVFVFIHCTYVLPMRVLFCRWKGGVVKERKGKGKGKKKKMGKGKGKVKGDVHVFFYSCTNDLAQVWSLYQVSRSTIESATPVSTPTCIYIYMYISNISSSSWERCGG